MRTIVPGWLIVHLAELFRSVSSAPLVILQCLAAIWALHLSLVPASLIQAIWEGRIHVVTELLNGIGDLSYEGVLCVPRSTNSTARESQCTELYDVVQLPRDTPRFVISPSPGSIILHQQGKSFARWGTLRAPRLALPFPSPFASWNPSDNYNKAMRADLLTAQRASVVTDH